MRSAVVAVGPRLSALLKAYYLGPDHPMKLRLYRWLRRSVGRGRLTVPYAQGWLTVDERDLISESVLKHGAYEPEVWNACAALLAPGDVVWDIGANIGTFCVRALLDARASAIHAFEPDPESAAVLQLNLRLNAGSEVVVHEAALGDAHDTLELFAGPVANRGLSSVAARVSGRSHPVRCDTADRLVFEAGFAPPSIVKIDVEGWESHVLRGMSRLFGEHPPRVILFEAACAADGAIEDHGLTDQLSRAGYSVEWIRRPSGEVEARENYVAVRGQAVRPVHA